MLDVKAILIILHLQSYSLHMEGIYGYFKYIYTYTCFCSNSIFQIGDHISSGAFPAQLAAFLENPRVLKVRRNVQFNLKSLAESSTTPCPFTGGLEIAQLAKEKGVIRDAQTGLADLCAKVLQ